MKVYITCTPEFSKDKLDEVVKLLQSIPGELKFEQSKILSEKSFKRLNKKFGDTNHISSFTFDEYFDIIDGYRENQDDTIMEEDFVILISSIRNNKNWFSAFNNKRSIFIHGDEWDLISDVDSKFGIAYQCIENIFQSFIDLNINDVDNEPNIHQTTIGCINDFCEDKVDILRKLQSANICPSCYQRALDKGLSYYILAHIISIVEEIRKEFVISKKFLSQTEMDKLVVDENGTIFIGDKIIKMEILPKVLYIGFLKQIEGIQNDKICESKNQFDTIYKILKPNPDDYAITKMCCSKIQYSGNNPEKIKPTFETYRSKIRAALKKNLGGVLSNLYAVNLITIQNEQNEQNEQNKQNIFKVPLSNGQIEVHPRFS